MVTAVNRQLEGDLLHFLPEAAYAGGIDGTMQWSNRTYYINAMGLFSHVRGNRDAIARLQRSAVHYFQRPDANYIKLDSSRTSLTGTGGKIEIGKGGNGRWRFEAILGWLSPQLELNDLGFMQQANLIGQGTSIAYVVNEPTGIVNNYQISFDQSNYWDFDRKFLHDDWELYSSVTFKNFWSMHGFIERDQDRLNTSLLRGGPAMRCPMSP